MTWRTGTRRRGGALATSVGLAVCLGVLAGCGGGDVTPPSPTSTATATSSPPSPTPSSTAPVPTQTLTESSTSTPTSTGNPITTALPAALTGHVITRIPTTHHVIALTFDGGSGAQAAPSVLDTLKATGVPVTFFLTGQFADTYPRIARALAARGAVGNHTMTHPHLPQLTAAEIQSEVTGAESTITATIRRAAQPWFRFPYGDYDARTLSIVNRLGYAAVGWTVDTLGWEGRSGSGGVDAIVARVLAKLQPGEIVLMHLGAANDGTTLDADALPALINAIRHAGYSFVTVDSML